MRSQEVVEKCIVEANLPPVVIGAGNVVDILPDQRSNAEEIAYIEVQNIGNNSADFAYGHDADKVRGGINGALASGATLRVRCLQRLSMYSSAGTTIGRTVMKRMDLITTDNIIGPHNS